MTELTSEDKRTLLVLLARDSAKNSYLAFKNREMHREIKEKVFLDASNRMERDVIRNTQLADKLGLSDEYIELFNEFMELEKYMDYRDSGE